MNRLIRERVKCFIVLQFIKNSFERKVFIRWIFSDTPTENQEAQMGSSAPDFGWQVRINTNIIFISSSTLKRIEGENV